MKVSRPWYVRRGKELHGPYPAGLVSQYLLLGRLRDTDEVSQDREEWVRLFDVEALIPQVLRDARKNPDDPEVKAHLASARRWADERRNPHLLHAPHERRKEEPTETLALREARAARGAARSHRRALEYAAVALLLAVIIGTPFLLPPTATEPDAQCDRPAAPGVTWNGCLMAGRDLSNVDLSGADLRSADLGTARLTGSDLHDARLAYALLTMADLRGANLRGARMNGANLRGADLRGANLAGADLSYALLSNANLTGADLTGARLDSAEWAPGIVCLPGSVGTCRQAVDPSHPVVRPPSSP